MTTVVNLSLMPNLSHSNQTRPTSGNSTSSVLDPMDYTCTQQCPEYSGLSVTFHQHVSLAHFPEFSVLKSNWCKVKRCVSFDDDQDESCPASHDDLTISLCASGVALQAVKFSTLHLLALPVVNPESLPGEQVCQGSTFDRRSPTLARTSTCASNNRLALFQLFQFSKEFELLTSVTRHKNPFLQLIDKRRNRCLSRHLPVPFHPIFFRTGTWPTKTVLILETKKCPFPHSVPTLHGFFFLANSGHIQRESLMS